MVILALGGLSVAQIISTASNLYLLNLGMDKRTLSFISGGVMSLVCFVPTYREYRVFTFIGLIATTYTNWYMVTTSVIEGSTDDVEYTGPTSMKMFFTCFSSIVFMFGTHSASIEKADVMNKPDRYDIAYVFAMLYVYSITIPNGVTGYYAYGSEAAMTANAFYLFPDTVYRSVGISLMCLHEVVAFGLFAGPLFHMLEKSLKIDNKGYWICTSARFIIVAIMLFFAVAFPFFGVINGLLGAFTTTFCTYVLPSYVYNKYFNNLDKFGEKKKYAWFGVNFNTMRIINWIIIVFFIIFGFGFGGWATITKVVDNVESMSNGFFAKCYQC
jgi:auxin influx carrier (AUX1 LAX family)